MVEDVVRYAVFAVFPVAMAYAAASDLLTMMISNKVTLVLVVAFVALAPFTGMDWQTFALHWAAGAAVLVVMFVCFSRGWVGGGDAKLASAIALWVGLSSTVELALLASLFGGALTMLLMAFRRTVVPVVIIRQPWVQRLHDSQRGVPYGIALAAAALATYPHTIWMRTIVG
jgi:prepilin peptidase CpaA